VLATVASSTLVGIQGRPVTVEVHVGDGLPCFSIVGLPDASCRESRDRVRAAITSSGLRWPQRRVTVNLAPTGLRKGGAGLDLPIAIGLLVADGQLPSDLIEERSFLGELGLDGAIRPVAGVLSLVDAMVTPEVVVAAANLVEAGLIDRTRVRPAMSLRGLVAALKGDDGWPDVPVAPGAAPADGYAPDLAEVRGQSLGRVAIEVAAAGGHHLLLVGPPGAGKTMLSSRLVGLLPDLSIDDALEVTRIHSAAGLPLPPGSLIRRPPLRAPHHSASVVSLIGGGTARMRPGEISCAHRGVLFMDELTEFPATVLDTLRQPLEAGEVLVCRARASVTFPARFLLVAAMNPCPCGSDGRPGSCRCSERTRARYLQRISGPLLDRFDLRVHVERPDPDELLPAAGVAPSVEATAVVAGRVADARRCAAMRGAGSNALIPSGRLDELVPLTAGARRLLEVRLRQGRLSARGLHRVRRVARTVADLAGRPGPVEDVDVHTALGLRADVVVAGEATS
jgi:magnesium chelatase family protein